MDSEVLQMAGKAALIILDPTRLGFLGLGVMIGLLMGAIPGLGGIVGLSILLPFTFTMDPFTALAILIGLSSVVVTSDTIPAVLFGVPGTVGSAATILDGFPMAKRGEAGRAFGAAFTASVLGGLFGALLLGISIPFIRPLLLFIGAPELLAISILGLSLVAVLSGGTPLKGLTAAALGLLIATAGTDPQTATERFTFDSLYLSDGLPLVPLALGLFALPELADLAIARAKIAGDAKPATRWSQIEGVKDVFKNLFLVLRCSAIGASLGAMPGIGASIIDWIAYGHAARTEKGADESFGKGDVRGVIASESSNNAKEGGALIPTIAFGVPGSASMALLLAAFVTQGMVPGPEMLTKNLDFTYTLVWSLAIANILGAGVSFLFANQLAKIASVRIGILVPVVIAITYIGAFQGSRDWGDLIALLFFGLLGWIMKRLKWPRPPLLLGFVLGSLIEPFMVISVIRYGAQWLKNPIVLIILAITLYGLLRPAVKSLRERRASGGPALRLGFYGGDLNLDAGLAAVIFALFVAAFTAAGGWEIQAKIAPQIAAAAGIFFSGMFLLLRLFTRRGEGPGKARIHFDISSDYGDLAPAVVRRRAAVYFAWCAFYLAAAAVVGLLPAMALFLVGYLKFEAKESWLVTIAITAATWTLSYILFHRILHVPWPVALIGELFPGLRTITAINFF